MYNYPTLDPLVKNGISLSAQEKTDLKSFLNTLNDTAFIHDIRFQLPQ
jgi:cytochrome c peroxidase